MLSVWCRVWMCSTSQCGYALLMVLPVLMQSINFVYTAVVHHVQHLSIYSQGILYMLCSQTAICYVRYVQHSRVLCFASHKWCCSYGCMCMMLWVLILAAECSRTSVLVSVVFLTLCQPCAYHVRTFVCIYVYGAIILMYACSYSICACSPCTLLLLL